MLPGAIALRLPGQGWDALLFPCIISKIAPRLFRQAAYGRFHRIRNFHSVCGGETVTTCQTKTFFCCLGTVDPSFGRFQQGGTIL
jgi:hypothetical protein